MAAVRNDFKTVHLAVSMHIRRMAFGAAAISRFQEWAVHDGPIAARGVVNVVNAGTCRGGTTCVILKFIPGVHIPFEIIGFVHAAARY